MKATKPRPRGAVSLQETDAALYERALFAMREAHANGDPTAARYALQICATFSVVMPPWLAKIVNDAIELSNKGEPDEVLGLGSPKMLRKELRARRNAGIRQAFTNLKPVFEPTLGVNHLIAMLANTYRTSAKNIEKIVYDL